VSTVCVLVCIRDIDLTLTQLLFIYVIEEAVHDSIGIFMAALQGLQEDAKRRGREEKKKAMKKKKKPKQAGK